MKEQQLSHSATAELDSALSPSETSEDSKETADTAEFQITIRKLEKQVRPRGVLAE